MGAPPRKVHWTWSLDSPSPQGQYSRAGQYMPSRVGRTSRGPGALPHDFTVSSHSPHPQFLGHLECFKDTLSPDKVTDFFLPFVPDGHHVWEMEAKTDRDLCKPVST